MALRTDERTGLAEPGHLDLMEGPEDDLRS